MVTFVPFYIEIIQTLTERETGFEQNHFYNICKNCNFQISRTLFLHPRVFHSYGIQIRWRFNFFRRV